jgi:DNA-binding NarL/FixJ family response regulator
MRFTPITLRSRGSNRSKKVKMPYREDAFVNAEDIGESGEPGKPCKAPPFPEEGERGVWRSVLAGLHLCPKEKPTSYLVGVNTLLTPQTLVRNLLSASTSDPSWILLCPGHPRHQVLWTSAPERFSSPDKANEIARFVAQIPSSGQIVTSRAPWVASLVSLLLLPKSETGDFVILPIVQGARIVACVGWQRRNKSVADFATDGRQIREAFIESSRICRFKAEIQALHWMVSRSDRAVAYATTEAVIVETNPTASDLLMNLQYGPRHFFRSEQPRLPKALAHAIGSSSGGQIKVNDQCTARFDEIVPSSGCFPPLVGIEFLVEQSAKMPQPLSRLTPVEREVAELMRAGLTNQEIAARRGCAFATIKNQVSTVLDKMGVARRQHLLLPSNALPTVQLRNPGMNGSTASIK